MSGVPVGIFMHRCGSRCQARSSLACNQQSIPLHCRAHGVKNIDILPSDSKTDLYFEGIQEWFGISIELDVLAVRRARWKNSPKGYTSHSQSQYYKICLKRNSFVLTSVKRRANQLKTFTHLTHFLSIRKMQCHRHYSVVMMCHFLPPQFKHTSYKTKSYKKHSLKSKGNADNKKNIHPVLDFHNRIRHFSSQTFTKSCFCTLNAFIMSPEWHPTE